MWPTSSAGSMLNAFDDVEYLCSLNFSGWMTLKRRKLRKKQVDLVLNCTCVWVLMGKFLDAKQRIELIQGFEMPMLSSSISMTRDGQYIFVTGMYIFCIKRL